MVQNKLPNVLRSNTTHIIPFKMKKYTFLLLALVWAQAAAAQIALPPLTTTTVTVTKDALDRVIRIESTGVYDHSIQYDAVGNIVALQRTRLGTVLPVELAFFIVTTKGCDALLQWQTKTERNTDRFIIECSNDGINYKVAGSIKAAGNTTLTQNYSFTTPIVGKPTYYRLQILDFDGSTEHTNVLTATCEGQNALSLYPNPTDAIVNLYSETTPNSIEVVDMLGRTLSTIQPTENNTAIDLSAYAAGVYYIRVKTDKNVVKSFKSVKN